MIYTHTTEEPQADLYDACPSCGYSPCECDQYRQVMRDERPDVVRALMGWPAERFSAIAAGEYRSQAAEEGVPF